MASLTLTIGTLTVAVSETNTRATAMLQAYADSIGASGTNQQKAEKVLLSLVRHMREQAHRHRRNAAASAANESLATELGDLYWGEAPPPETP
jgi:hypothetical protein